MVFDGCYQPNLDDNIGAVAWGIHCTDTYRYAWGYLPSSSQVENAYISELTGLYEILSTLESVCQLYHLNKR